MSEEKNSELISVSVDLLKVGMKCPADVFSHDKKLVLLRKDDVLDEVKLNRLRRFNTHQGNVHVDEATYDMLVHEKVPVAEEVKSDVEDEELAKLVRETLNKAPHVELSNIRQIAFEDETGYSDIKKAVANMLLNAKTLTSVNRSELQEIQANTTQQVLSRDVGHVLQCLSASAPVDEYLQRHCVNVGLLNGLIGKWLNLGVDDISTLVLAGISHDLGMAKIPKEIIYAPRKLTMQEMNVVKLHSNITYDLLQNDKDFDFRILEAAKYHHERTDGSGYPEGKTDKEIPGFAKITAISDIYNAMISERSYRKAMSPLAVLKAFADDEIKGVDKTITSILVQKMPTMFIGKTMILSDGSEAVFRSIMPNDILYPIVEQNGVCFQLSDNLSCKSIIFTAM